MTTVVLQSLGESVVMVMPNRILSMMRLGVGSQVDVDVENGKLVVEPKVSPRYTLAGLLAQCNKENMTLTADDHDWLDAKPVGKELL
jgi:Growth regulator